MNNILYLNIDCLFIITNFLNFNNILNFSISSKFIYQLFDDLFYKNLAINYFSNNFWKIAKLRPKKTSFPLNNYKKELIRIENFQKQLDILNIDRWCKKDFYNYWKFKDCYNFLLNKICN